MINEQDSEIRQRIAAIPGTCVNINLRRAMREVSASYDAIMAPTGLHANQLAMLIAPYLAGPISINNMAEKTGLDRTTLVRNLKPIEERGLITVKPGEDLRMRIVTLTPKGKDILEASLPLWEEAQRQVIERLGSQYPDFMAILKTLNDMPREP